MPNIVLLSSDCHLQACESSYTERYTDDLLELNFVKRPTILLILKHEEIWKPSLQVRVY